MKLLFLLAFSTLLLLARANEDDPSQQFFVNRNCAGGAWSYGIEYWHDKCFYTSQPQGYKFACNATAYYFDVCQDQKCGSRCQRASHVLGCQNTETASFKFSCGKMPTIGPKGFYLTQYHRTCPNDEYVPLLYFSGEHCIPRTPGTDLLDAIVPKTAGSTQAYYENGRAHIKTYESDNCQGTHLSQSYPILTCIRTGNMFLYFDAPNK